MSQMSQTVHASASSSVHHSSSAAADSLGGCWQVTETAVNLQGKLDQKGDELTLLKAQLKARVSTAFRSEVSKGHQPLHRARKDATKVDSGAVRRPEGRRAGQARNVVENMLASSSDGEEQEVVTSSASNS